MCFNNRPVAMLRHAVIAAVAASLVYACTDAMEPGTVSLDAPVPAVDALNTHTIRVQWQHVVGSQARSYVLERRANLNGAFSTRAELAANGDTEITFVDTNLEPGTFYGYRVRSVARLGGVSSPSRIVGARTPPAPGIDLRVSVIATDPLYADNDGFTAIVTGPTAQEVSIAPAVSTLIGPLEPGTFTLTLTGVREGCVVSGGPTRTLTLTDAGLNTVVAVDMNVVCSDPTRGGIVVNVVTIGDTIPATTYTLKVVGTPGGQPFSETEPIVPAGPPAGYTSSNPALLSLLPGEYEVSLLDVDASICDIGGEQVRNVDVTPMSADTVRYSVTCSRGDIDTGAPIIVRHEWEHASAVPGQQLRLFLRYDGSARPGIEIGGTQFVVLFDQTLVQIDSVTGGPGLRVLADNLSIPGRMTFAIGCDQVAGKRDTATVARMSFTVVGQAGRAPRTTTPRNEFLGFSNCSGDIVIPPDSVRIIEDTLFITTAQQNQLPTVDANGPYSASAGSPVSFIGTAADVDGAITGWAWTFGDGATASVQSPSHVYSAPGSYIARLTVTDNGGASATDSASVTITQAAGGIPGQYAWRNEFSAATVAPGETFTLRTFLKPPVPLYLVQGDLAFDSTVVRLDSMRADAFWTSSGIFTQNMPTTGLARVSAFRLDNAPANDPNQPVPFLTMYFTAIGASGTSAATFTSNVLLGEQGGGQISTAALAFIEDTIAVGGDTPPQNQAPVVVINGPYSGTIGQPVLFRAVGTTDPDGDSMLYLWDFGDGTTSGLITSALTYHIYQSAGSFDVSLVVTDSRGASTSRTTTAVIAQP